MENHLSVTCRISNSPNVARRVGAAQTLIVNHMPVDPLTAVHPMAVYPTAVHPTAFHPTTAHPTTIHTTLPSLLRISAVQYLHVMSFCGLYDKEKGLLFHTKFNDFLSSHDIQSASKFSRKNKNSIGRDVGWYLKMGESTNRCKDESSIVPKDAKAQLDRDIVATEDNGRMPRVLKEVREVMECLIKCCQKSQQDLCIDKSSATRVQQEKETSESQVGVQQEKETSESQVGVQQELETNESQGVQQEQETNVGSRHSTTPILDGLKVDTYDSTLLHSMLLELSSLLFTRKKRSVSFDTWNGKGQILVSPPRASSLEGFFEYATLCNP